MSLSKRKLNSKSSKTSYVMTYVNDNQTNRDHTNPNHFAQNSQALADYALKQQSLSVPALSQTHKISSNSMLTAATQLFSLLSGIQLGEMNSPEIIKQELNQLLDAYLTEVTRLGISQDYALVSQYILCECFDELIAHKLNKTECIWQAYTLTEKFCPNLPTGQFFTLLELITYKAVAYIDLLELMFVCLSLGYKGTYQHIPAGHLELALIKNTLYQHIQQVRGPLMQTLSSTTLRTPEICIQKATTNTHKMLMTYLLCLCLGMIVFICLTFVMDNITNEVYSSLVQINNSKLS